MNCPVGSPSPEVFRRVWSWFGWLWGHGGTAGARLDWGILKVSSSLADSMSNKRPRKRNKGKNYHGCWGVIKKKNCCLSPHPRLPLWHWGRERP